MFGQSNWMGEVSLAKTGWWGEEQVGTGETAGGFDV